MSNHHLRNKEPSLKAKGLLSQMLSLPEDWDYRRNTALSVCGAGCTAWFFHEDPADNAVQFVQLLTADAPLRHRTPDRPEAGNRRGRSDAGRGQLGAAV